MPAISQKHRPIGLILMGGGPLIPFTFGVPGLGAIRPQDYTLMRPSRGQVVHTASNAFLDTFGEGVAQLNVSGHTGWGAGLFEVPGIILFKALEFIFVDYHLRQKKLIEAGQDPQIVQLWWMDTLNLEALSIYPLHFQARKTSSRPLLYYYTIQAVVLHDFLSSMLGDIGGPAMSLDLEVGLASASGLSGGFTSLAGSFAA